MDYVRLGGTGTQVSRLCLGCMTFGDPDRGRHEWTLREEASRPLLKKALDLGINFLDTANVYSDGTSEEIVGRAIRDLVKREDVVLATKVHSRMRPGPNGAGLSRKAIMAEIDDSLRRLGTDYVDLYQIHRFDPETPIEETLEALHDVVKAGKARYIGASSMYAWQFAKMIYTARAKGWSEFVTMQDHLNLLNREECREMVPFCRDQGIGVVPWSPLARGRLARAWDESTKRQQTDPLHATLYGAMAQSDRHVVEIVGALADERNVSRATVALAWLLQQPGVTAPIVGASKEKHLDDAVAALSLHLDEEEMRRLDEAYVPHPVAGFS